MQLDQMINQLQTETKELRQKHQLELNSDGTYHFKVKRKKIHIIDLNKTPIIIFPYIERWVGLKRILVDWFDVSNRLFTDHNIKDIELWMETARSFVTISTDILVNLLNSKKNKLTTPEIVHHISQVNEIDVATESKRIESAKAIERIFEIIILIHYVVIMSLKSLPDETLNRMIEDILHANTVDTFALNSMQPINKVPI